MCGEAFANAELFPTEDCKAAMVLHQANTGYVVAMLGGRNTSVALALNRATSMRRQPGSMIKPIIAYAPALEYYGYTVATMLLDERTGFVEYSQRNFSDKYYG